MRLPCLEGMDYVQVIDAVCTGQRFARARRLSGDGGVRPGGLSWRNGETCGITTPP